MRAAHIVSPGEPEEAISIVKKPKPTPDVNEVRVRVEACALNHLDIFARTKSNQKNFPKQTGVDISGRVDAYGNGVKDWEIDEQVIVYPIESCEQCEYCLNGEQTMCDNYQIIGHGGPDDTLGGLAEYITVPANNLEPMDPCLSFEEAAAWPVTFTTAWRMIVSAGKLRPSETALILGASGGVGNAALKIANRLGATTYATTSTEEKADRLRPKVKEVINYTTNQFDRQINTLTHGRGVDLVAEHVGEKTWQRSIDSLAKGGRMVVCGATSGADPDIDIRSLYQSHRHIIGAPMGSRQDFNSVYKLIKSGEIAPEIQDVLPLEAVAEGHRRIEERDIFGKIVIRPKL